jgi:hypothetical protein
MGTCGFRLADEPPSTDLIGFGLATARYAQGGSSRCRLCRPPLDSRQTKFNALPGNGMAPLCRRGFEVVREIAR